MAEFNDATANIISAYVVSSANLNFGSTLADNTFYSSIETLTTFSVIELIGGTAEGNVKKTYWRN